MEYTLDEISQACWNLEKRGDPPAPRYVRQAARLLRAAIYWAEGEDLPPEGAGSLHEEAHRFMSAVEAEEEE